MEVVLGSQNEPKRLAVESAFKKVYPAEEIEVVGVEVDSGVSSHPTSGDESLEGAQNRAKQARQLKPKADYYGGIEGGLVGVHDRAWELGWVAIENSDGRSFTAPSSGVEVQGKILAAIRSGQELNDILRDNFDIKDAGKSNGYYGLVTDNVITREQAYEQAIIFALAPFTHTEYFQ